MREEKETGSAVHCPFCRSSEDCPHLVAVIDETFAEIDGGYAFNRIGEFRDAINESFQPQICSNVRSSPLGRNKILAELWRHAVDNYIPGDEEISIDQYVLMRLITALFEDAGGRSSSYSEDGPPGYSSAMCVFHAKRPSDVFETALTELRRQLQTTGRAKRLGGRTKPPKSRQVK